MRIGGRITLAFLLTLLAVSLHVRADDAPAWTAWLHYGRHMTLIDSEGHTLHEFDLPLPEQFQSRQFGTLRPIVMSNDARFVAYVVRDYQSQRLTPLVIFDTATNHIVSEYSPRRVQGDNFALFSGQIFNDSNTAFAIAYTTLMAKNTINVDVVNTITGEPEYHLGMNNETLGLTKAHTASITLWSVQSYKNQEITFCILVGDVTTGDQMKTFRWNPLIDTLQPDKALSSYYADSFQATGEIISRFNHPAFPKLKPPSAIGWQPNVLQVYDPLINASYPFYWEADTIPEQSFFVQNGERILIHSINIDKSTRTWSLLERDGTTVDEWTVSENMQINGVKNTPDGFIYNASLKVGEWASEALPAIYEVNTRDNQLDTGHLIWQIPMEAFHSYFDTSDQPYLDIVLVHSDMPVGPFKPWAQLADPVYAPTPEPSTAAIPPTSIPTPPPLFHVGQTVRVQTIDGEILNLRAEPTRKSEIIVYIEDETQLELLEGPIEAEGYHWWRVHTPDGLEGWVVENDGELQTILPM